MTLFSAQFNWDNFGNNEAKEIPESQIGRKKQCLNFNKNANFVVKLSWDKEKSSSIFQELEIEYNSNE